MSREAVLSLAVRKRLQTIGLRSVRLEETSEPGIPDLLMWEDKAYFWFLELKVDAPLRPEQRHWLARQWARGFNAYLLRYCPDRQYRLWTGGSNVLVLGHEVWSNIDLDVRSMTETMIENFHSQ
jgi:hypothetical protein